MVGSLQYTHRIFLLTICFLFWIVAYRLRLRSMCTKENGGGSCKAVAPLAQAALKLDGDVEDLMVTGDPSALSYSPAARWHRADSRRKDKWMLVWADYSFKVCNAFLKNVGPHHITLHGTRTRWRS